MIAEYDLFVDDRGLPYLSKTNDYEFSYRFTAPEIVVMFCDECLDIRDKLEEHAYIIAFGHDDNTYVFEVSKGGMTSATLDVASIARRLLLTGATQFVFVHNHPCGTLAFSKADKDANERLECMGNLLNIPMRDSIIVTKRDYISQAELNN